MAHKKAGGSTKNGRDSKAKRLGVKRFAGQAVISGNILVRQRGNKFFAGKNTKMGKDFTIYATCEGKVAFSEKRLKKFNQQIHRDVFVNVESI